MYNVAVFLHWQIYLDSIGCCFFLLVNNLGIDLCGRDFLVSKHLADGINISSAGEL